MIFFVFLIGMSVILFSLTESAKAAKEPDYTDYTPMYEELLYKVLDIRKSITTYEKSLSDNPQFTEKQILEIEKRIEDANGEIIRLHEEIDKIQELNIESYRLDPETQKIFDDVKQKIKTDYFGKYGVHLLIEDTKQRKITVYVDAGIFNNSNYPTTMADLFAEISNSVDNVDIVVEGGRYTLDLSYPTYAMPINKQVENNIKELYCINEKHILVVRPNMDYSCITIQSNEIVQWTPVHLGFDAERYFGNITTLQADENGNLVSYNAHNGFISDWYYSKTNSIHFNINTIDDGDITLSIKPQTFDFDKNYSDLIVLDNLEEITHTQTIRNGTVVISFDFTHPDPVIEIIIPSSIP